MSWDDEVGSEPTRDEINRTLGPDLIEFGATWCGHCQALAPELQRMLKAYPNVRHIKVEDGPGRPLGRSFRVKLWPTLVFLKDGEILKQISRPEFSEVQEGLNAIAGSASGSTSSSMGS